MTKINKSLRNLCKDVCDKISFIPGDKMSLVPENGLKNSRLAYNDAMDAIASSAINVDSIRDFEQEVKKVIMKMHIEKDSTNIVMPISYYGIHNDGSIEVTSQIENLILNMIDSDTYYDEIGFIDKDSVRIEINPKFIFDMIGKYSHNKKMLNEQRLMRIVDALKNLDPDFTEEYVMESGKEFLKNLLLSKM